MHTVCEVRAFVVMNNFYIELGTSYNRRDESVGITWEDLGRHLYLIGKTGTGKTTLLENIVTSVILKGEGVCFLDPHGDAISHIASLIPKNRTQDVVWFNPSDKAFPIAFNVLEDVADPDDRATMIDGIMSTFKHLYANAWGDRTHDILSNTLYALMESGNKTLADVPQFLNDEQYRTQVLKKVQQPDIRSYFFDEYGKYSERFRIEVASPTLNKLRRLLVNPTVKNIIGQRRNKLDIKDVMDSGKILLVDLSKGKIGEEASKLLGGILINKINFTALQRANAQEEDRRQFALVIDEFQRFGNGVFGDILSEARKYKLALVAGHQYVSQVDEAVTDAMLGNAGSQIAFRVGSSDAEELHGDLDCSEETLRELSRYQARARLLCDGDIHNAVTLNTVIPHFEVFSNTDKIQGWTRDHYCTPREKVENRLAGKLPKAPQNLYGKLQKSREIKPDGMYIM